MQSDGHDSELLKVSGESPSREEFHPRSVAAVRQEPKVRSSASHDLAEHRPSATAEEPLQELPTNVMSADGVNVVSVAVMPPQLDAGAAGQGSKTWLARLGLVGVKARREVDARPDEKVDAAGQEDFNLKIDEPLALDGKYDRAVIRSKVQFTKTADGTQTLSYEEDLVKPEDHVAPRCGMGTHQELGQRRKLRSTFLNFLRCPFLSSV